eukprot:CAMPEP_0202868512 /NCGR_PEP_ID=MMETSP1391-20130828/10921_1 /ASSEMBLY_ACC=CAM_ASM_000867 /TAXON_ID=1034604 /ORGANISM="Chlamydomonas leiostraca, Strain SAG 11-49" /LENGTH=46 /DNA_ID= /DNA_START= /DNA_END= /DNA_ORIENTATION=
MTWRNTCCSSALLLTGKRSTVTTATAREPQGNIVRPHPASPATPAN